jgi:hypothetical protein
MCLCGCHESQHETVEYRGDKPRACLGCSTCKRFRPSLGPGSLSQRLWLAAHEVGVHSQMRQLLLEASRALGADR